MGSKESKSCNKKIDVIENAKKKKIVFGKV